MHPSRVTRGAWGTRGVCRGVLHGGREDGTRGGGSHSILLLDAKTGLGKPSFVPIRRDPMKNSGARNSDRGAILGASTDSASTATDETLSNSKRDRVRGESYLYDDMAASSAKSPRGHVASVHKSPSTASRMKRPGAGIPRARSTSPVPRGAAQRIIVDEHSRRRPRSKSPMQRGYGSTLTSPVRNIPSYCLPSPV